MAMNKWVKRKWLRALRSGEYGKGTRRLGTLGVNQYCCLGVLVCEMVPEFVKYDETKDWVIKVDTSKSYLPDDLAILWGLDYDTQRRLASINDANPTFDAAIAYIEANL